MFEEYERKIITDFRGPWTVIDEGDVPSERALLAKNVRYLPGQVASRDGHTTVWTPDDPVWSMHHWLTSGFSALIYLEGSVAKIRWLHLGSTSSLFNLVGHGHAVAEAGLFALIATYNSSGLGAGQCYILNTLAGFYDSVDKAFQPPCVVVPTMTAPSAGTCTAGTHRFGYVVESRSGFIGKPSPAPSDVFAPVEYTVAANKTVRMTIVGNVPVGAAKYHVIMTRADNLNRWYFVPDAVTSVPSGAAGWTATIDINYSDGRLAESAANDASEQFNLLSQAVAGTGPFNPAVVLSYGNRVVYIADSVAYASEPHLYQHITQAKHLIVLPQTRRMVTGMVLGGTMYLFGPHWTYASRDSGDKPVEWDAPELIDGSIGTSSPKGVTLSAARDYGWVAHQSGLYLFDGRYGDRPISYHNSEWERINWAAAARVQVIDDPLRHEVHVIAPLDTDTVAGHELVWNYARGKDPDSVDFSLNNITSSAYGSVAMVEDYTTKSVQRWHGPGLTGGKVLKHSTSATDDDGVAISSEYKTGPLIGSDAIEAVHAVHIRIRGSGEVQTTIYTGDEQVGAGLLPIFLQTTPKVDVLRRFYVIGQNIRLYLTSTGHWILSRVIPYWNRWSDVLG